VIAQIRFFIHVVLCLQLLLANRIALAADDTVPSPVSSKRFKWSRTVPFPATKAFVLSPAEGEFLNSLFLGTVDYQLGIGNNPESLKLGAFMDLVKQRWDGLPDHLKVTAKQMDKSTLSPMNGWLIDHGFHIWLGALVGCLAESCTQHLLAEKVSSMFGWNDTDMASVLKTSSYRVPSGFSFASSTALGGVWGQEVREFLYQKAFRLDANGQPAGYEPGLQNILAHLDLWREHLGKATQSGDKGVMQVVRGYAYGSLANGYRSAMNVLDTVEILVVDLQGILDSIRYKMSMAEADTIREIRELRALLAVAIEKREHLIRVFEQTLRYNDQLKQGRWQVYDHINSAAHDIANLHSELNEFFSDTLDEVDRILGFDGDVALSLKLDTPWELSYYRDRENARSVGLAVEWQSIRSFNIIVQERYKTYHYTRNEKVGEDDKGNDIYEDVDYSGSSHETDEETVDAPPYEREIQAYLNAMAQRLAQLGDELKQAQSTPTDNPLESIESELVAKKREHARYAELAPTGKDESEHKLPRIYSQQAQFRALLAQTQALTLQLKGSVPTFSRLIPTKPTWEPRLEKKLEKLDASRHRKTSLAIGTAMALGTGVGACKLYLDSHGGGW
jgi:hypothetical protein